MILWFDDQSIIFIYMDVDPSTSYMHWHGCDHGKHNEYLYYETPPKVLDRQKYQQESENQEEP